MNKIFLLSKIGNNTITDRFIKSVFKISKFKMCRWNSYNVYLF